MNTLSTIDSKTSVIASSFFRFKNQYYRLSFFDAPLDWHHLPVCITSISWVAYTFKLNCSQALAKFLKSVQWKLPQEEKQALEMLAKWNPMDVEDALELLSPAYPQPAVRKYAVARLKQAEDEVITTIISQYENQSTYSSQFVD